MVGIAAHADLTAETTHLWVAPMSRPRAFIALVLSGLLLLAACSPARPAKPAAIPAIRVGSVVRVGPYTQVFATALPANSAEADVLEGFREAQVLWEKSENAQVLAPEARDYVTGQAFSHLVAAVKAGKSDDLVPAGTDRLFMTRVTAITGHNAVIATCDDGSKFRQQNPQTGKADLSLATPPAQQYLSETWRMVQLSGHWAISSFSLAALPSRSAEYCQPGITGSGLLARPNVPSLIRQMTAAARAASSVHIDGSFTLGAKAASMNLGFTRSGDFSGQVSENGALVTVLGTHGHVYLKLSASALRLAHLPATACDVYCGRYVEITGSEAGKLAGGLTMTAITRSLIAGPASKIRYFGEVTFAGQLAWLLQDSSRKSIYVAAQGTPYILGEVSAPPAKGSLSVTQWNAVRVPGPPPASKLVHIGQLSATA